MSAKPHHQILLNASSATSFWYDAIVAASTTAVVFDLNDLSTLFQNTAGTTPVTAVGQTVKAIRNKGAAGGFATSSTGATLTLDSGIGKNYLVPPASNGFQFTMPAGLLGHVNRSCIFVVNFPGNTANYEYAFQCGLDSDGNGHHLVMGNNQSDGFFEMFSGGAGGGVGLGLAGYLSGRHIVVGTQDIVAGAPNDDFGIYIDSTTASAAAVVNPASVTSSVLSLGDYTTTGAAPVARFYEYIFVDRVITGTEMATVMSSAP